MMNLAFYFQTLVLWLFQIEIYPSIRIVFYQQSCDVDPVFLVVPDHYLLRDYDDRPELFYFLCDRMDVLGDSPDIKN